jgi:Domain of unknown function (DUF397)
VSAHDLAHAVWRKSTRSGGGNDSNCVEVAYLGDAIAVRDSRQPAGPVLTFNRAHWSTFIAAAKGNEFGTAPR